MIPKRSKEGQKNNFVNLFSNKFIGPGFSGKKKICCQISYVVKRNLLANKAALNTDLLNQGVCLAFPGLENSLPNKRAVK